MKAPMRPAILVGLLIMAGIVLSVIPPAVSQPPELAARVARLEERVRALINERSVASPNRVCKTFPKTHRAWLTVEVQCPTGKELLYGGCSFSDWTERSATNAPSQDRKGWTCSAQDVVNHPVELCAIAVCTQGIAPLP